MYVEGSFLVVVLAEYPPPEWRDALILDYFSGLPDPLIVERALPVPSFRLCVSNRPPPPGFERTFPPATNLSSKFCDISPKFATIGTCRVLFGYY